MRFLPSIPCILTLAQLSPMVSNCRELKDIKGGRVNNVVLEPKDCNLTLDSNCKLN